MGYEIVNRSEIPSDASSVAAVKTFFGGPDYELAFKGAYLDPGESSPAEDFVIHPECEQVEFIVYGTGRAAYPDGSHRLRAGDAVYHSAGQPHRFENDSDEPLIYVVATVIGDKDDADRVYYTHDG